MEALIVYAKIEVKQDIKSLKPKEGEEEKKDKKPTYKELNYLALEKELSQNRKLI